MQGEQEIAGLRCGAVLERLSLYLEGELDAATRQQVEQHVQACSVCERFGREFATLVHTVRALGGTGAEDDKASLARLQQRLAQARGPGHR